MKPGPRLTDWLLLLGSLAFTVVAALLLVAGRDARGAIACLTFFGMCTAVATWILVLKLRMRASADAVRVSIVGGVAIPSRDSLRWIGGAGLAVGGSILVWSGAAIGVVFQGLSVFMAGAGVTLMVLLATKRVGGHSLTFSPEGLRVANGAESFVVRWTNLAAVDAAEFHSNPVVLLHVRDADEVVATAKGPDVERARRRVARMIQKNRGWVGCDVFFIPYHFGLDAVLLTKALAGYAAHPERRAELALHWLPAGDRRDGDSRPGPE
ncbi:MAG TPA: hypothetical protein VK841_15740 [Polyangiaceae bacterium]|jgi:hypothetical protein|nr:hypothetical protein [Polyangiaceae bacterium]